MKIEFFYKCKNGKLIGKETESENNIEEEINAIKSLTEKLEQNQSSDEVGKDENNIV